MMGNDFKEGDIIVGRLSQADGKVKSRPLVLLRQLPRYGDFLVCGITTQLKQYVRDFDEILADSDADFAQSGLISTSVIRLGFLAVIEETRIAGSVGSISTERHQRMIKHLSSYLEKAIK
jgi:mRNA interferase MazF